MGPVLCLVTDRRRCGASWEQVLVARTADAARAGVHLVQVRERDLDARPLVELVRRTVAAVAGTRCRVVVNDRVDVAIAGGAHGVHLPATGVPAARLRPAVPAGFLIGRSVHGLVEAVDVVAAGGVDYLLLGTVFPSSSKPDREPCGTRLLAAVARSVPVPVLGIGGIAPATLPIVAATGAAGVAGISLFDGGVPDVGRWAGSWARAL
ncbi:MAG: thiamine phosphate synthase [Acidimicrobiia bacterium]|nr:thiamine phosphate synthase [Acidimicrobiia bacterium]